MAILRRARFLRMSNTRRYGDVGVRNLISLDDLPRAKGLPLVGTKLDLLLGGGGTRLQDYIDKRHKQLGPIFVENIGGANAVFISDPESIRTLFLKLDGKYPDHILPEPWILYNKKYGCKRGLFFMNGEEWLHHRKIANKHLLREGGENWIDEPVSIVTSNLVNRWKNKMTNGVLVPDLEDEFYQLAIDVIVSILLGSKTDIKPSIRYEELLKLFSNYVKKIFKYSSKMYVFPASYYAYLQLPAWNGFKESVDMSLIMARKLVNDILQFENLGNGLIFRLSQEDISKENLLRVIADLIIAAGDTSTYTLLWTLYLLGKNPEVYKDLQSKTIEMDAAINRVIKESMRLFPVAPFLTRIILQESVLNNIILPIGTPIVASIYTTSRDSKYFYKPTQFIPDRWDRNIPKTSENLIHTPLASMPFAMGARSCIGKKIAMVQLTQAIKQISQNFNLTLLNKNDVGAKTSLVLVPKDPIKIQFSI